MENNIEKLIKTVGYGIAIHYNELKDEFEVYKIGTYHPGDSNRSDSIVTKDKSLVKALNAYIKGKIS